MKKGKGENGGDKEIGVKNKESGEGEKKGREGEKMNEKEGNLED